MRRIFCAFALAITTSACGSFDPYEASCLNDHVAPNYGAVRGIPGGFEVIGSGVQYTPMEITQPAWSLRPATFGDPADDYPKPLYRSFRCRMLDD